MSLTGEKTSYNTELIAPLSELLERIEQDRARQDRVTDAARSVTCYSRSQPYGVDRAGFSSNGVRRGERIASIFRTG